MVQKWTKITIHGARSYFDCRRLLCDIAAQARFAKLSTFFEAFTAVRAIALLIEIVLSERAERAYFEYKAANVSIF